MNNSECKKVMEKTIYFIIHSIYTWFIFQFQLICLKQINRPNTIHFSQSRSEGELISR